MEQVEDRKHECEVCRHIGEVEWEDTPYKPGYYCQDGVACFERFRQQRNKEILETEPTESTNCWRGAR